jgi:hypothetical protein
MTLYFKTICETSVVVQLQNMHAMGSVIRSSSPGNYPGLVADIGNNMEPAHGHCHDAVLCVAVT